MTPNVAQPIDVDSSVPIELSQVAEKVRSGGDVPQASVRTLLSWFNAQRRGTYVVQKIAAQLVQLGMKTDPDFDSAWIDSEVSFVPRVEGVGSASSDRASEDASEEPCGSGRGSDATMQFVEAERTDPTYRIGRLKAANGGVVSVGPNSGISEATAIMLANEFSQLPVMQGSREVKGVVSWQSLGARLALGLSCDEVRQCMSAPNIIDYERSIFEAIHGIARVGYVLVQKSDRLISGIITSADLGFEFQLLAEPFLLLGEIEKHIRKLISGKFTIIDLKTVKDPVDPGREVEGLESLTLGEYMRLLQNPVNWDKLNLRIDRATFIKQFESVCKIRNRVMHFDKDSGTDDLLTLRQFARFMQLLGELGAV